jgi:hypothetical protein
MNLGSFNVILPKPKALSNKDHIVGLKVGEDINAPYHKRTTIAPLISNIKREFKGRDYETNKITVVKGNKKVDYLNIKRIA